VAAGGGRRPLAARAASKLGGAVDSVGGRWRKKGKKKIEIGIFF
jgi:hypothetical protein